MTKVNQTALIVFILIIVAFSGCSELFINPDIPTEPVEIFNLVWNEFDRYYPFFIDKQVDWDSIYTVYSPRINNDLNSQQLFQIISEMLALLRDGHVNVYTPYGTSSYTGWYDQYPQNFYFNFIENRYLPSDKNVTGNGNIHYGKIGSIGYIYIESFAGDGSWAESIDEAIEELKDLNGIIVDVRHNGGGSSANANFIAGRFTDRRRVYSYVQYRNGPRHTDFTGLRERTIAPGGKTQYLNPVVLLTNRSTFSAAEDFTLAMKELPHVTHYGDTTGGGLGNPVFRELPNEWGYRLPVWRQLPTDLTQLEGIGIAPDLQINIIGRDHQLQIDTILEHAIDFLKNQ